MQWTHTHRYNVHKGIRTLLATALMLGLMGTAVSAETLKIVTIDVAPFGFVEDGVDKGLHYDFANRIAEEAGFSPSNTLIPYARVMKELTDGTADCSILYLNDDLKAHAVQVAPVITYANIVFGLKGTPITSLEDLHGKRVAQVRGAEFDKAFSADEAIIKHDTKDFQQSVKMLIAKRLDAVIGSDAGLYAAMKREGVSLSDIGEPLVLNTKEAWLHCSKKTINDATLSALKSAAEKLTQDGTVESIKRQYLASE